MRHERPRLRKPEREARCGRRGQRDRERREVRAAQEREALQAAQERERHDSSRTERVGGNVELVRRHRSRRERHDSSRTERMLQPSQFLTTICPDQALHFSMT